MSVLDTICDRFPASILIKSSSLICAFSQNEITSFDFFIFVVTCLDLEIAYRRLKVLDEWCDAHVRLAHVPEKVCSQRLFLSVSLVGHLHQEISQQCIRYVTSHFGNLGNRKIYHASPILLAYFDRYSTHSSYIDLCILQSRPIGLLAWSLVTDIATTPIELVHAQGNVFASLPARYCRQ